MYRIILIASALALAGCASMETEEGVAEEAVVEEEAVAAGTTGLVSTIEAAENLSTFASAIEAAGLEETLAGPGPFTIFAPSNAAFAALPEGAVDQLLAPENRERLRVLIAYHVVPGSAMTADFGGQRGRAQTAMGAPLVIDATAAPLRVNDASVTAADIETGNGVLYVIDRVLVPQVEAQGQPTG